jgi:cell division septation protein DedD
MKTTKTKTRKQNEKINSKSKGIREQRSTLEENPSTNLGGNKIENGASDLQNDLEQINVSTFEAAQSISTESDSAPAEDKTSQPPAENETTTEPESSEEKPQVKETRGRHKKGCECTKCQAKRKDAENAKENGKNDLLNDLSEYTQTDLNGGAPAESEPAQVDLSKYISGALLLIALDAIFPALILNFAKKRNPKKYGKIKVKQMKLTPDEREELEPLADEVIKILVLKMHPAAAFLIAYGIITAGKLLIIEEPKE